VEDRSRGLLVINMAGDGQVDDAQIVFAPVEQNQRVIDAEPVQSEDDKSETLKDQMDGSSND
jgi:hypothetical protein